MKESLNKEGSKPESETETVKLTRKPFSLSEKIGAVALGIVVILIIVFGLTSRRSDDRVLAESTEEAATPVVDVAAVTSNRTQTELVLPGNTQAFYEAGIYARTNGYLKKWYADIGAYVRPGQLLAEIQTPEVDRQLEQARADYRAARENMQLAQSTATRWQMLLRDDAVSQQETDQYVSDLEARKANLESGAANVRRLEELQSFERIIAPFAGVITTRNTDVGDLINAGSGNSPKELFHVAAVSQLRIYVALPEADLSVVRLGAKVALSLDEFPQKVFEGRIVRTSDSIDQISRTLKVEVDVDNPKDQIKTGSYVRVHFTQDGPDRAKTHALTVPANAVLFRSEGLQVAVVRNHKAELVPVVVGRDFGSSLEVVSGLSEGDRIILNPSDSLANGTPVRVAGKGSQDE
jgi:RND family efflux transporter MFP subunit